MTKLLPTLDMFRDLDRFFVGFDDQYNRFAKMHDDLTKNIPNYPPYNIKKVEENKYVIELAVAGFAKSEIEVQLDGDYLIVSGKTNEEQEHFIYRGIANRAFTRKFSIADSIVIKNAEMINGMLKIFLEKIVPDHRKPKKIEVQEKSEEKKPAPQLLTEDDL